MSNQWFLLKNGLTLGPHSTEALRGLIENKSIGPSDLLSTDPKGEWKPASSLFQDDFIMLGTYTGKTTKSSAQTPTGSPNGQSPAAQTKTNNDSTNSAFDEEVGTQKLNSLTLPTDSAFDEEVGTQKLNSLTLRMDKKDAPSAQNTPTKNTQPQETSEPEDEGFDDGVETQLYNPLCLLDVEEEEEPSKEAPPPAPSSATTPPSKAAAAPTPPPKAAAPTPPPKAAAPTPPPKAAAAPTPPPTSPPPELSSSEMTYDSDSDIIRIPPVISQKMLLVAFGVSTFLCFLVLGIYLMQTANTVRSKANSPSLAQEQPSPAERIVEVSKKANDTENNEVETSVPTKKPTIDEKIVKDTPDRTRERQLKEEKSLSKAEKERRKKRRERRKKRKSRNSSSSSEIASNPF